MHRLLAGGLVLVAVALYSVAAPAQDRVINYNQADRAMNGAIAQARRTLPDFLKALKDNSAERYSVKVPIRHPEGREHIWMTNVRAEGDEFAGEIENEPEKLRNVKKGSPWRVKQNAVSDWYFVREGKMHGAWTIRVMLPRMPAAQRAQYEEILAR